MLELKDLEAYIGENRVLRGVSLEVPKGFFRHRIGSQRRRQVKLDQRGQRLEAGNSWHGDAGRPRDTEPGAVPDRAVSVWPPFPKEEGLL